MPYPLAFCLETAIIRIDYGGKLRTRSADFAESQGLGKCVKIH